MTLTQLLYAVTVAEAGSMNEAAKTLFVTQPSLSTSIRDLEDEVGILLFKRSNHGVNITPDGKEFIGYARQVLQQYELIENKYIKKNDLKKKFSVSLQHYTFGVNAFVELVKQYDMDEYEFAIHETKTIEVMENVKNFFSEIGILYLNEYNRNVLEKYFVDYGLEFHALMHCGTYVYMAKSHPLSTAPILTLEELKEYPCLSFDQGMENSFYFAEEVLSSYQYPRTIRVNDRATMLNLMEGLGGYTLCCGIVNDSLNGAEYTAVPLDSDVQMTIGYICRRDAVISDIGKKYLDEISKYKESNSVLDS